MGPWSLDTSQNISKPSSPIFTRASLADYKGPPWQVPWWPTRSAALGRPGRIIRIRAKAVGLLMAHVPVLETPPEVGITRHESDLTWLDEVSRSFTLEQLGSVVNSNTRSIRHVTLCIDMLRKALSSQHGSASICCTASIVQGRGKLPPPGRHVQSCRKNMTVRPSFVHGSEIPKLSSYTTSKKVFLPDHCSGMFHPCLYNFSARHFCLTQCQRLCLGKTTTSYRCS